MRLSFLSNSPDTSLAGRMNIRSKLLLCLAASLAAIVLSNPQALALLCVVSAIYALTAVSLAGLLRAYLFFLFMCLISLGFTWLASFSMPELITWEVGRFVVPYMRMLVSLNALLVLAFSSRIQDLMRELQAFGRMAWIHVPLTVAVRFLPTFLDDCLQVRDAYRLRSPLGRQGITEASTTRRPSTPRTRSCGSTTASPSPPSIRSPPTLRRTIPNSRLSSRNASGVALPKPISQRWKRRACRPASLLPIR